jgi:peptidoglycan/xylan/chitin deacetylase (PgdA/CDA1 family)
MSRRGASLACGLLFILLALTIVCVGDSWYYPYLHLGEKRGIVSFSFDDGTLDFLDNAFPVLRKFNVPASLSVIVGLSLSDMYGSRGCFEGHQLLTADEIVLLAREGIEILSHGLTHRFSSKLSDEELLREVEESKVRLREYGIEATGFAVPYGEVSSSLRKIVPRHYNYMRSSDVGYNDMAAFDLYALKVQYVTNKTSPAEVCRWIDYAFAHDLWLILLFHRVKKNCSQDEYCTRTEYFEAIVEYARRRVELRTIGDVVGAAGG